MNQNTKLLAIATFGICIIMFYAGLRPKGFRLHNDVTWLAGTNGIHFGRRGIAYTESQTRHDSSLGDSLTIELAIKVPEQNSRGSSTILSLWSDDSRESVHLFQWKNSLMVEKRDIHFFRDKIAHFGTALEYGKRYLIFITSCWDGGTIVYVNGEQSRPSAAFSLYNEKGLFQRLAIGNSGNARNPWHGDFYSLSIYRRVLSQDEIRGRYQQWTSTNTAPLSQGAAAVYPFDEHSGALAHDRTGIFRDLQIPPILRIPQKEVLTMPWKDFSWSFSFFSDMAINFFGFVPFGFFFCALLQSKGGFAGRHRFAISLLTGFGISLFFELVQVYMPTRSSQMSDLIMNTLGTVAGILVFKTFVRHYGGNSRGSDISLLWQKTRGQG